MKPAASSFRRRQRVKSQGEENGKPSYTLDELLAQWDFSTPRTEEEQVWLDIVPVGREFGSAEFDELERQAEVQEISIPDLADAAERERLSASAIQAFVNIARKWQLSEEQTRCLLGADKPTYRAWQTNPYGTTLGQDAITRISLATGIYRALHICHGEKLADQWVTLQNRGQLFAGRAPIDYMIEGGTSGMKMVRRLFDSQSADN
jgi:hypothetical protein